MPDALLTWALTVYCAFHVLGRSDLLRRPREWAQRRLPRKLTYPLTCAFCFAFWCGLALTAAASLYMGTPILSATILFAVPIFNMVLDLAVRALLKANEPPMLAVTTATASADNSCRFGPVSIPSVWTALSPQSQVTLTYLNPSLPQYDGHLPYGWEMHKAEGDSIARPRCPSLIGRRIRIMEGGGSWAGQEGVIEDGYRDGDDCSGTWGDLKYRVRRDCEKPSDGSPSVPAKHCLLLPAPPTSAA